MADARAVSDRYTDAINAHDAQAIAALFAEDGVLVDPSGEYRGRQAVARYWESFFAAFPDISGHDETEAESGEIAINEWVASATHTGPLETPEGTVPATGKRVELRGADAMTVSGGLITSHRVYYDQMAFMTQLGLVPEGAVAG